MAVVVGLIAFYQVRFMRDKDEAIREMLEDNPNLNDPLVEVEAEQSAEKKWDEESYNYFRILLVGAVILAIFTWYYGKRIIVWLSQTLG